VTKTRVLVVEDESIVALDLQRCLTRLGHAVAGVTARGDDAVRLAGELRPDLVLMDIRLQGEMDGVHAAEQIRHRFQVPVVYLTAHADEATLQRAKVTEPFGYVLKPFDERDLRTVLEMALYKHEADRKLRSSERRYAATLGSIADAVIATDPQGQVTFMNRVAERLTAWPLADATRRPVAEVFRVADEETRQQAIDAVARVLREGAVVEGARAAILQTRDGREVPIEACAAPIQDDQDSCTGAVLVFRDVTERRRVEAERRQLEEQLRQAQKMDAVGQLAGGVAHDFNNLLTIINGCTSMVLDGIAADHPWHGFLTEVHRAGERAADLVRQLLVFSRRQLLQPRVLDLNQVLADIGKMVCRLIGEPIELITVPAAGPLLVKADPGQLEQVIVNLAVNARDAMPDGGKMTLATARVHVEANAAPPVPEMPPGRYARLTVGDTGCGMDAATRSHLFEPFFTTKELGKGSGLGLATVYGITRQTGGYIDVSSEVGKGTTFCIYLPAVEESMARGEPPLTDLPHGTETVLLVEGEEGVRILGREVLRRCGYTVLEARQGVEALDLVARYAGPLHLLVTDLVMPQMHGRTLATVLSTRRSGLKALFVTGSPDPSPPAAGVNEHKSALLLKPYTPTSLARKVREVLDEGRQPPA
jgi:PAS domain S-box-containing protein